MGEASDIGWTDATWNPWMGCSKVSPGCDNCYMFRGMRQYGRDPEVLQRTGDRTFYSPLRWKEPRMVFTCSWSDFFHQDADGWREDAWKVILDTPQHTYQILTKRIGRVVAWSQSHPFPDNVWIGTSVENQKYLARVLVLARIKATVRFISCEPLLGPLDLSHLVGPSPFTEDDYDPNPTYAKLLDWVIDGGESGSNQTRRPAEYDWFRLLRDQCQAAGIPYFHKQGNAVKPGQDRVLDGRTWDQIPTLTKGTV